MQNTFIMYNNAIDTRNRAVTQDTYGHRLMSPPNLFCSLWKAEVELCEGHLYVRLLITLCPPVAGL